MKSMLQSKQSDQIWFSLWMLSSKFLLPLSVKSGKRLKMKREISMAAKKAKVNVNVDCYSLIKGQWKLMSGNPAYASVATTWLRLTMLTSIQTEFWVKKISPLVKKKYAYSVPFLLISCTFQIYFYECKILNQKLCLNGWVRTA